MGSLAEVELMAKKYYEARGALEEKVESYKAEVARIKKTYLPGIRRAAEIAADKKLGLKMLVEDFPELFVRPRTYIFHGIKIGYQKGKGKIAWEDDEQVIKLIHKHFPEQAEVLIKITETPMKTALAELSVADLKKIGVTVVETDDEVVIKPTDSEIEKLVNALLKDDELKAA